MVRLEVSDFLQIYAHQTGFWIYVSSSELLSVAVRSLRAPHGRVNPESTREAFERSRGFRV